MSNSKKLVLIDGNAAMHRAYHAMPPMRTPDGEPIAAIHGFVSMLLGIIEKFDPMYLSVAWDRPEKTHRQEKLASYQAQRPPMESDLSTQFEKARAVLEAMNIKDYSVVGYEADDVIGTIAKRAREDQKVDEVIIVTGDRDILQLVDNKVKVYMPIKGMSEGRVMDTSAVKEKMGVLPKNIVDYKALVGDSSDNYPGVPGIGPKTALDLINTFGAYSKIYENLRKLPKNQAEKLEKGKESGDLSYDLATIVTDSEVPFTFSEMADWNIDSPKVMSLFETYGFKSLPERVKKLGHKLDVDKQQSLF
jgi:DNA polymerase-1